MDKKEKKQMSFYKKCSLFTLIIAIATLMMSIGYASINSITLDIVGSLTAKENIQTGIYVSDYVLASANGTNDKSQKIKKYYGTLINGEIVLDSDSSSVTYTVKVFNNSDDVYKFDGIKYDADSLFFDNENIIVEYSDISIGDRVSGMEEKTFTITFRYKDNKAVDNNVLNYYIDASFIKIPKYKITYNDIDSSDSLPSSILEGDNLEITLTNPPSKLIVTMGDKELVADTDYAYKSGVFTLNNVTGDVVISKDLSALPGGNYLEATFSLQNEQNGTYTYAITAVKNTTSSAVNGWALYIKLPDDAVITNSWGSGITVNLENGILSFTKASSEWGEPFPAGGTQSWVGSFTFTSSLSPSDFYPFEYSSEVTYK